MQAVLDAEGTNENDQSGMCNSYSAQKLMKQK